MVVPSLLEGLARMQHLNHKRQLLLDLQRCPTMTGIMLLILIAAPSSRPDCSSSEQPLLDASLHNWRLVIRLRLFYPPSLAAARAEHEPGCGRLLKGPQATII